MGSNTDNPAARYRRPLDRSAFGEVLWHLQPLVVFVVMALVVFSASRFFLAWEYVDRLKATAGIPAVLDRAWHFDLVVVSAVIAIVVLLQLVAPARLLASRTWQFLCVAWLSAWLMLIVFNEAATPDFMGEFGVRPNRVYVEYLDTPGLVFATIWGSHRYALLLGLALTAGIGYLAVRTLSRAVARAPSLAWPLRLLVLLPLLILLGVGARGGMDHRPLSVSNAVFSTDPAINDLALNSTYSSVHALVQMMREQDVIKGYGELPREEVLRRVEAGMQLSPDTFTDPGATTEHRLVPTARPARKPNLVILLQESLGAQYFASLGGRPVAQRLEQWRTKSFWFDRLYASGTRSARGIEAVVTGFLPTRARSVIKLEGAQQDFFTIARALKEQGYRTEFIYGGDADFDNMRRFFLHNGFDKVTDWTDLLPEAAFKTTWGVSDEDLYARVHREASEHAQDDQPFFMLVFSTSNHPPYDFPDGRIELYEQPKQTHDNSARYADYAVGRYLETAEGAGYWDNTVFVVVADHESKSVGTDLVPIFSFHIPAFIAGGPVAPRVVDRLASQVDLIPTVLSLMGVAANVPATGIDQSRLDLKGPGRAIMQFNENAAYRVGDQVVVLVPAEPPRHFAVDGGKLVAAAPDAELERDALAHSVLPLIAYRERWYR